MINDEVLYFAEDGGSDCDIHGRDSTGQYFTIVRGDAYNTETTGLAFSPDSMFMYVAFQGASNVYSFWRTDGLPFDGKVASTKYHWLIHGMLWLYGWGPIISCMMSSCWVQIPFLLGIKFRQDSFIVLQARFPCSKSQ